MQSETSIQNAVIKRAELISSDHGCLTTWLTLDYGSTGQKFGGYTLYLSKGFTHHSLKSTAGHFIWRVMEIAGVAEWDRLVDTSIRVRADHYKVHAIGHIIKDDWFCPSEDFANL